MRNQLWFLGVCYVAEPAAGMDTMIRLAVHAQGHETSRLRVEVTLLSGYK